jgi:hypothetical protein
VRATNTAIDGRYVIFQSRRIQPVVAPVSSRVTTTTRTAPVDPLVQEMTETLRAMGLRSSDEEVQAAIRQHCPKGPTEGTFEADLRAIFDRLRRRDVG